MIVKKNKLESESVLNNEILESVDTLVDTLSRLSVVGGPPVVFTSPQLSVQNQKGSFWKIGGIIKWLTK